MDLLCLSRHLWILLHHQPCIGCVERVSGHSRARLNPPHKLYPLYFSSFSICLSSLSFWISTESSPRKERRRWRVASCRRRRRANRWRRTWSATWTGSSRRRTWMRKETNVSLTHVYTDARTFTPRVLTSVQSVFVSEGAAIAKKKMMKKFGWYKHNEDGGGASAVTVCCCVYLIWSKCLTLNLCVQRSPTRMMTSRTSMTTTASVLLSCEETEKCQLTLFWLRRRGWLINLSVFSWSCFLRAKMMANSFWWDAQHYTLCEICMWWRAWASSDVLSSPSWGVTIKYIVCMIANI